MASSSPTTSIPIQEPVFLNFFMMFTMLTFYYIEQWRYYHPRSFPTLNLLLFPVQTYGINRMGYDHITRTRPTTSLTMPPSHRRILWRTRHLWMNWSKPISLSPHHHVAAPSPDVLPAPSKLLPEHHHRRIANKSQIRSQGACQASSPT